MSRANITFSKAELLNKNCPASSGGETFTIARKNGHPVAEIIAFREPISQTSSDGFRVDSYEVDWFFRDDVPQWFSVGDYTSARAALRAAKEYIRGNA